MLWVGREGVAEGREWKREKGSGERKEGGTGVGGGQGEKERVSETQGSHGTETLKLDEQAQLSQRLQRQRESGAHRRAPL